MTKRRYPEICGFGDCPSPHFCKGFCRKHFERWMRHGDPGFVLKAMSDRGAPRRWLRDHVTHSEQECLLWPFARSPDGRAHMKGAKPTRVMCELAHGAAPSASHEAAHSCGKAYEGCVHPQHLRWATPVENAADKEAHGTVIRGERHPAAKLTEADVRRIRELAIVMTQTEIAGLYGVRLSAVNKVVKRKSWAHVS